MGLILSDGMGARPWPFLEVKNKHLCLRGAVGTLPIAKRPIRCLLRRFFYHFLLNESDIDAAATALSRVASA